MTELLTWDDNTAKKMQLPTLTGNARQHGIKVKQALLDKLTDSTNPSGEMPFEDYMQFCLYQAGLGYYSGGLNIFDEGGDFITSPSMGKLFASSLATAIAPLLADFNGQIIEVGAGNGALAIELVKALTKLGCEVTQYTIIELSPSLMNRQQQVITESLPDQKDIFRWENTLPETGIEAIIVANEVLDAMPHCRFKVEDGEPRLISVNCQSEWGVDDDLSLSFCKQLTQQQRDLLVPWLSYWQEDNIPLPEGLESEYSPYMPGWLKSLEQSLSKGLIYLVDYGSVAREYYLPQREGGTFICHYQHFAHDEALLYPGMQDLSASVDFTAVAHFGLEAGLELVGITTQAAFLTSTGLLDNVANQQLLQQQENKLTDEYRLLQETKRLLMPGEMGERFKVLLFGKAVENETYDKILGFSHQEISDQL